MMASYLARTGLTLASSLPRARVGVLDEVRHAMRVWPTDLDVFGHMNNGRYLTLMDFGRLAFSVRTGIASVVVRRRWTPTAGAATIRFRRELQPFAKFELATRLAHWDAKWLYFEHRLFRGDALHARAFVMAVVKQGRATIAPAELLAEVGHHGPPPEPSEELALWIRAQAGMAGR